MPRDLTKKQEAFAQHFCAHGVATDAYKAAGYSWKNMKQKTLHEMACKLAKSPKVYARLEELREIKAERLEKQFNVTVDSITHELAAIGFANMHDYIRTTDQGDAYVDLSDLTRTQAAAITEISVEEYKEGRGEDARDIKRTKFKLADKRGALVDLGRHLGMFEKDNKQLQPNINVVRDAASDFDSRIAGVFARTAEAGDIKLPN